MVKRTREKIRRTPKRNFTKLAFEAEISEASMRRLIKEDLGMTSYKIKKRQFLNEAKIEKRLTRSTLLLRWLEMWNRISVIWTDEKLFTVEAAFNRQNDRVMAVSIEDVPMDQRTVCRSQGAASVMVWAGVTSCGKKTPLIFIDKGVKINQNTYRDMLASQVLPWIRGQDWPHGFVFQQDGAPAHTSNMVQDWCQDNFRSVRNGRFWPKNYWPPCSPDLNMMDFAIWGMLAQRACSVRHNDLDSLKRSLQKEWLEISEETIHASCLNAVKRLEAVVEANGGYIEDK